jgi:hypothetical protein
MPCQDPNGEITLTKLANDATAEEFRSAEYGDGLRS